MAKRIRAILEATDLATPTFARVERQLTRLGAVAGAIGVFVIGRQLVKGLQRGVAAAQAQSTAVSRLSQGLRNTGQQVEKVLPGLVRLASELENVTNVGDDVILSNQNLFLSVGATSEQLDKYTRAALDLSAGLGISLESATRNLGKTLSGMKGELGELIPELRTMTKEQLQAGAAFDVVARKFAGQSTAVLRTYEGGLARVSVQWTNVLEKFGEAIVLSPSLNRLLEEIGNKLFDLSNSLDTTSLEKWVRSSIVGLGGVAKITTVVTTTAINATRAYLALAEAINAANDTDAVIAAGSGDRSGWDARMDRVRAHLDAIQESYNLQQATIKTIDDLVAKALKGTDVETLIPAPDPATLDDLKSAAVHVGDLADAIERAVRSESVSLLDSQLTKLGLTTTQTLAERAYQIEEGMRRAVDALTAGELTPERFGAIAESLEEMAEQIRGEGGIVEGFATVNDNVVTLDEAIQRLAQGGMASLQASIALGTIEIEKLGTTIRRELHGYGVEAALALGDHLVDAAARGAASWKEFARGVLEDLARIAARMFVLNLIGSFASGAVGAKGGGGDIVNANASFATPSTFAAGGFVHAGGIASVHTGEYVLDPGAVQRIGRRNLDAMNSGRGEGGGVVVTINQTVDLRGVVGDASLRVALERNKAETVDLARRAVADAVMRGGRYAAAVRG